MNSPIRFWGNALARVGITGRRKPRGRNERKSRSLQLEHLEQRQLLSIGAAVSGTVFEDLDRDGILDVDEPGLENWTVELQRIGGDAELDRAFQNPNLSSTYFGTTVAALGEDLLVGSPDGNPDAVYLFDGATGQLLRTFEDPVEGGSFGASMAAVGGNVLVGDPYENVDGKSRAGAVYLFDGSTGSLMATFHGSTPATYNMFGYSLAAAGDDFVVGVVKDNITATDAGAAYLIDTATGDVLATFEHPSADLYDSFGYSVAADGDLVLVGAPYDDTFGLNSGTAYLFDAATGELVADLHNPAGQGRLFGYSVAMVGGTALIGTPYRLVDDVLVGEAHQFDGSGNPLRTLVNPEQEPGEHNYFGRSVGTIGDDFVVGDYRWGAAYRFDGQTGEWVQTYRRPETVGCCWGFPRFLAAVGEKLLVGHSHAEMGGNQLGAACLFGADGEVLHTLVNPSQTTGDHFGSSVAALGENLLVGVPNADFDDSTEDSGIVHMLDAATGALVWTFDNPSPAEGDRFGYAVVPMGDNVLISAPGDDTGAGIVYLFDASGTLLETFENPSPGAGDQFGCTVAVVGDAVVGNHVLIGAPYDDTEADDAGAVYLFDADATLEATFLNPTPEAGDLFGLSLAAGGNADGNTDGNDVLIGAPYDDLGGEDAGAVYLYAFDGQTWDPSQPTRTYQKFFPAPGDEFGWSIATVGDHVLISAVGDDTALQDAGAVYQFERSTGNWVRTFLNPALEPGNGFGWAAVSAGDDKMLVTVLGQVPVPGDLNGDGIVDDADMSIIAAHWQQTVTPGDLSKGDISGDGLVNEIDASILAAHWGQTLKTPDGGTACLFDISTGELLQTFSNPREASFEFFGMSAAAIDGNMILGAGYADAGADDAGAVYIFDGGRSTATTDNEGRYQFFNLEPGTYRARQIPQEGYLQSLPTVYITHGGDYTVTIDEGDVVEDRDFGVYALAVPVAGDDSYHVDEDTALSILAAEGVLANDSVEEHVIATVELMDGVGSGTLTLGSDGSFLYIPNDDFVGTDTFDYKVSDGNAESEVATVTIIIDPVNDPPTAVGNSYSVAEDTTLQLSADDGLLSNDDDLDGDLVLAQKVQDPLFGTLSVLNSDGSFTYVPDADFVGTDYFTYRVVEDRLDGLDALQSRAVYVAISVLGVNDAPIAVADQFAVSEDNTLAVNSDAGVLTNDMDADGDPLTAELVGGPQHGQVTLNTDGSFEYVPDEHYSGTDGFTYKVQDPSGAESAEPATVSIEVGSIVDLPTTQPDVYVVDEDTTLAVDAGEGVLVNDGSPDGAALEAQLEAGPEHGTLVLQVDGAFTYTPAEHFHGVDTFTYRASDGALVTAPVTVTVTVDATVDAPLAGDDTYNVHQGESLDVPAAGVLSNDEDPDGGVLQASTPVDDVDHGNLQLNADGSFSYTPDAGFFGSDGFTYRATADGRESEIATVTLTVIERNDAIENAVSVSLTGEKAKIEGAIGDGLHGASDVDVFAVQLAAGEQVVADVDAAALDDGTSLGGLDAGLRVFNAAGEALAIADDSVDPDTGLASRDPTLVFTANETGTYFVAVSGFANFRYDPQAAGSGKAGSCGEYELWLRRNTAPVANTGGPLVFVAEEDAVLNVSAPGVLAQGSDAEGDPLAAVLVDGPTHGTLSLAADGSFAYTPAADFVGEDTFSFVAGDGFADSEVEVVTVQVSNTNDAPVAVEDDYTVRSGETLSRAADGGVLANDIDIDPADDLQAVLVGTALHGALTSFDSDGSFIYDPDDGYVGFDTFSYKVSDGLLESETVTVTIYVGDSSVDVAPQAFDNEYTIHHDSTLVVEAWWGILADDFDFNGDPLYIDPSAVVPPGHGMLVLNHADGSFTYEPDVGFSGTDCFRYKASDGSMLSEQRTVTIDVTNIPPVVCAYWAEYTFSYGTALIVDAASGVLANVSDADDPLTLTLLAGGPTNGEFHVLNPDGTLSPGGTLNADGSFVYVPNSDTVSSDSFSYTVSDGAATSDILSVTLTASNDAPVAQEDVYSVLHGETLEVDAAGGVLGNDYDKDNDVLTVPLHLTITPSHGELVLNADGSFIYTPGEVSPGVDFVGSVTFMYYVTDTHYAMSEFITVTIDVQNTAPDAYDDQYTVAHNEVLTIEADEGILANDVDLDFDDLEAVVGGAGGGTLTLEPDGSFTYDPDDSFVGTDTFTYTVDDGADHDPITATIEFVVTNSAPWAGNDYYAVAENTTLVVEATQGLLANDADAEEDALSIELVDNVEHGTLTPEECNPWTTGAFQYEPEPAFSGVDRFTYRVTDGLDGGWSETVTVTIDVLDRVLVAMGDSYEMAHDTAISNASPGLLANDTESEEGETLVAELVSGVDHASENGFTFYSNGTFAYEPEAGFIGTDFFTYKVKVQDGASESNVAVVQLNVVNASPQSADDSYEMDEDGVLNMVSGSGVLANDTDEDDDTSDLVASLLLAPNCGDLTFNADGSFDYVPDENFHGTDSFIYEVTDGHDAWDDAAWDVGIVEITVVAQNDPPIFDDLSTRVHNLTVNEPLIIPRYELLDGVEDADDDELTVEMMIGAAPSNGSVALDEDGSLVYTPNSNYLGSDAFRYTVSDAVAEPQPAEGILVAVVVENTLPSVDDMSYSLYLDTSIAVPVSAGVLSNDHDEDGHELTATLQQDVSHGTLQFNPEDGSFDYTPDAGYTGTDTFTYVANDGFHNSATATVTLRVTANRIVASDARYVTLHDTPLVTESRLGVLYNDWDQVEDLPLTAVLDSGPAGGGSVTLNADGSFTYTPPAAMYGTDSFTYRAKANVEGTDVFSNPVTVFITVTNTAPEAEHDRYSVHQGEELAVDASSGVLVNDHDMDADALVAQLVDDVDHGTLALVPGDGSFTYTPEAGFSGEDAFTYRVSDGAESSTTVIVTIDVQNNAPVANPNGPYTVHHGQLLEVADPADGFLADDYDFDGDPLEVTIVQNVSHGELTWNNDGTFSYQGETLAGGAHYVGSDYFLYRLSDGAQTSNTVTVSIDVCNNVPWTNNDFYSVHQGDTLSVSGAGLLANDSDWDEDDLTVALEISPSLGAMALNADGSFTYETALDPVTGRNFVGKVWFTYKVFDGTQSSSATAVIDVRNHAPQAFEDYFTTGPGQSVSGNVLANDWDLDEDTLTAAVAGGLSVSGGTLTFGGQTSPPPDWDGSFTFAPDAGFSGTIRFPYTAGDGAESAAAYANVTVKQEHPYSFDNSIPDSSAFVLAVDDAYQVYLGDTLDTTQLSEYASVADNDWIRGDPFTLQVQAGDLGDRLTFNSQTGTFSYTPPSEIPTGYKGHETFTYTITVGTHYSTGTVTIYTIQPPPPTGADPSGPYTVEEDGTWSIELTTLLAESGFSAEEISKIELSSFEFEGDCTPNGADWLVVDDLACIFFTPPPDYHGEARFDFSIQDNQGNDCLFEYASGKTATLGRVTLTVTPQNDAPITADDSAGALVGGIILIPVLENDSDVDGPIQLESDIVEVILDTSDTHGFVEVSESGFILYVAPTEMPENEFDTFTYSINDHGDSSNSATVTVQLFPVNQAPSANNAALSINEDTSLGFTLSDYVTDPDWNGDRPRYFEIVEQPSHGRLVLPDRHSGGGSYTPEENWSGTDSFKYVVYDEYWEPSGEGTVTITVIALDDPPVTRTDYVICSGSTATINVLDNDFDPDGDDTELTLVAVGNGYYGTATCNGNTVIYTPTDPSAYARIDGLGYTIIDEQGVVTNGAILVGIPGTNSGLNPSTIQTIGPNGSAWYYGVRVNNRTSATVEATFHAGGVDLAPASGDHFWVEVTNKDANGIPDTVFGEGGGVLVYEPWLDASWSGEATGSLILTVDGVLTSDITIAGNLYVETIDDITTSLTAGSIDKVWSKEGSISGPITASGNIGTIVAEGDITGSITAGSIVAAGSHDGSICAGGDITGAVTATNGGIDIVRAIVADEFIVGGSISGNITAVGGDIGYVTAGYDITGDITASDGGVGPVDAGRDLIGSVVAGPGGISQVRAGRDITSPNITSGADIGSSDSANDAIHAARDIAATTTITAYGDIFDIATLRDLGADVSAGGYLRDVKIERTIEDTANIQAGGDIRSVAARLDMKGDIIAGQSLTGALDCITVGRHLTGEIIAQEGDIPSVQVGVVRYNQSLLQLHAATIDGATIRAHGDIGSVSVTAPRLRGGNIVNSAAIESKTGGIGSVTATGSIDADISARGDIQTVVSGYTYSTIVHVDGGDISGSITSTAGNVCGPQDPQDEPLLKANDGSLDATVHAARDVGNIHATANISGDITAGHEVGNVTAEWGSITGKITAKTHGIGNITAEKDIRGSLFAMTDIGEIAAGRNIGQPDASSTITTQIGSIVSVTAGRDQGLMPGNIYSDIFAGNDLGLVRAYGSLKASLFNETNTPERQDVPQVDEDVIHEDWLDGVLHDAPKVRPPAAALPSSGGDIDGKVYAGGSITLVTAHGGITKPIEARGTLGLVWARGDIGANPEGTILSTGAGDIDCCTWGNLKGKVQAHNKVTGTALLDILGKIVSHNGDILATTWHNLGADMNSAAEIDAWAGNSITSGNIIARSYYKLWAYGSFIVSTLISRGLFSVVYAGEIEGGSFQNPTGGVIALLSPGDISNVKVIADRPWFTGESAASFWKSPFGFAYVHAGGNIENIDVSATVGARLVSWKNVSGSVKVAQTGNIGEEIDALAESHPLGGLTSQLGFVTIAALGNVTMDEVSAHSLIAVESDAVQGTFKARNVSINASGNATGVTVQAANDIVMEVYGNVEGTISSTAGCVKIKNSGGVAGTITGARYVGIVSAGSTGYPPDPDASVPMSATISSPGIGEPGPGMIAIESCGDVTGSLSAHNIIDVTTWGTIVGDVKTERGYVQIFAACDVEGDVTAGGNAIIETWGSVKGTVSAGPENIEPENTHEYEVGILALGDVEKDVTALHNVAIDVRGNVTGNVLAKHGFASIIAGEDVRDISIVAHDDVHVIGWNNVVDVTVDATANDGEGEVTVESGLNAKVNVTAGNNVTVFAGADLEATVTVEAGDKSVDISALGKINKARITAPAGTVSVFAGSDIADVTVAGNPLPNSVDITTLGELTKGSAVAANEINIFTATNVGDFQASTTAAASRIDVSSGGTIDGTFKSGNQLNVFANGSVKGCFEAGTNPSATDGHLTLIASSDIDAEIKAVTVATVNGKSLTGKVDAGTGANVATENSLLGMVSAGNGPADVFVVDGNLVGTVVAGADATVFVGGSILGLVSAQNDATVSAQNNLIGAVTATDGNAGASAYGLLVGAVTAGSDVAVVGGTVTAVIRGDNAKVLATGTLLGAVWATDGDATVTVAGPLIAPVSAQNNANVTSFQDVLGTVTAETGDAEVFAGKTIRGNVTAAQNATVQAADNLLGNVTAELGDVEASIWGYSMGNISAGNDANVIVQGCLIGDVTAENNAQVTVVGDIPASIKGTNGNVTVVAGGCITGNVTAGGSASATVTGAGRTLAAEVAAGLDANVLSLGTFNGIVTAAAGNASVSAWEGLKGSITAGVDAYVWSGGTMGATVTAGTQGDHGNATVTAYDTATVSVNALGSVWLDAIGRVAGQVDAGGNITLTALADAVLTLTAGGDVDANVLGWLAGNTNAGGDVFATAGANFTGSIETDGDAFLMAIENIAGSAVTAGGWAEVAAWGIAADVVVDGDEGAWLFSYNDLLGQVTSAYGTADAFSGGLGFVTVIAGTDASALSLGDLHAWVTAGDDATDDAAVMAVGELHAVVQSGGNTTAAGYADARVTVDAGADAVVASVGKMLANVTAGGDVWAVAYDDLDGVIAAGNNVELVGSLGRLTGTVVAGNYVRRAKSYRSIDALILAGGLPEGEGQYGVLDVVEAWETIDGQLTAKVFIGTVRSGESVLAGINAPSVGAIIENDRSVRGPIPSAPRPADAAVRAWLAGQYRSLLFARQDSLAVKEGLLVEKPALEANLRNILRLVPGDRREAEAAVADAEVKLGADVAAAEDADAQKLAEGKRAFADNQRRAEAAWKQMKTEAGNRLHDHQQALENSRQQREDETVLADAIIVDLKAEKVDDRSHVMEAFEYDKVIRPTQWEVEAYNAWRTALKTAGEMALNVFQFSLDVAGFIPLYGEICDGLNGCIYLLRGNKLDAGISFAATIPCACEAGKVFRLRKAVGLGKRLFKFVKIGDNLAGAAKWMRGASKVDKMHGFSKICKMDIPACFVGNIHIVMAGRPNDPAATPVNAAPITTIAAGPNWLYSAIILGLGITTYAGLNRRNRRLEQHERDALIDALFNSDEDLDNLDDDLCTTLARREQFSPCLRASVVNFDEPIPPRTVLDRPATRRIMEVKRKPEPMSIRRWQPRKTSTPIPKPHRRSRLGLAILGFCLLLSGLFGYRAWTSPPSPEFPDPPVTTGPTAPAERTELRTKAIKDMVEGDWVLARDEKTGELAPQQVTQVFRHTTHHLRVLDILAADGQATQEIQTTDEHPFWVEGRGWVEAGQLQPGNQLIQTDGQPAIVIATRREEHPEGVPVFNIEVAGHHTYFVAANATRAPPVWVHNKRLPGLSGPERMLRGLFPGAKPLHFVPPGRRFVQRCISPLINRHHPWPKYLGGPAKQALENLPTKLHEAYHKGLDKLLPRWKSTKYFQQLSGTQQAKNFEKLRKYTEAFDKKHGTKLWDAIKQVASTL